MKGLIDEYVEMWAYCLKENKMLLIPLVGGHLILVLGAVSFYAELAIIGVVPDLGIPIH